MVIDLYLLVQQATIYRQYYAAQGSSIGERKVTNAHKQMVFLTLDS